MNLLPKETIISYRPYTVLLFYKYVSIDNPEKLKETQFELCRKLSLTGRMIIALEGINGALEGTKEDIDEYCLTLAKDPRFEGVQFKKSSGTGVAFPRLSIKIRDEIVSAHLKGEDIIPTKKTGKRLSPEKLDEWYEEDEDFVVVDMRNDYEYVVGQFEKTVESGMKNFRDLKRITKKLEPLKTQKVVTVCTGGVRCEKASGYLLENGFENVYQLDGGIHSYIEKFPNKHFKGSLYTFDQRKTYSFDEEEGHEVIGLCEKCGAPTERYADCMNSQCPRHFLCCEGCQSGIEKAYCSILCRLKILGRSMKKSLRILAW